MRQRSPLQCGFKPILRLRIVSRDRGTTYADGASRGAPQAIQIADRWHVLHNLGEALEKVLARHHVGLKCAFTGEAEHPSVGAEEPEALARAASLSQTEQLRRARRLETFTHVQALTAASAGVVLPLLVFLASTGKTAVKYATAERFHESRSDRGGQLAPYVPFLHTQWAAGEHTIAHLYQTIRSQGYQGSETSVRAYIKSLREEIGPPSLPYSHGGKPR